MTSAEQQITEWVYEVATVKKAELPFTALRFGISETLEGYLIYLAGHETHSDESDDWSIKSFSIISQVEIARNDVGEWYLMLIHLLAILGNVLRRPVLQASFLTQKPVYAGFDDGDLIRLQ